MSYVTKYLLVTCSRDDSRAKILERVVDNLKREAPGILLDNLLIFDNCSTISGTVELLKTLSDNVYVSNKNVGYWTAIKWFLNQIKNDHVDYIYIIESDLIHHNMYLLNACEMCLERNPDVGGVRLHEYSVENWKNYDKEQPSNLSKRNAWRSHKNVFTEDSIHHVLIDPVNKIFKNNFVAHLPALNRYNVLLEVFEKLATKKSFTELDFQREYFEHFRLNAIIDGGLYKCLGDEDASKASGSFSPKETLISLGYEGTRTSKIISSSEFKVVKV